MKMRSLRFAALLGLAGVAAGCTNGQGEVDVTTTNVATFPAPPASVLALAAGQTVTTDGVVSVDLQKDLADLEKLGQLSGDVSKNAVSGDDLGLLAHIKVTIGAKDGTMPTEVLSEVDVARDGTELDLPLLVSPDRILSYLEEGKVDVHFYLTGTLPDRALTLTHTMVAHVDVAMKGSVLKF